MISSRFRARRPLGMVARRQRQVSFQGRCVLAYAPLSGVDEERKQSKPTTPQFRFTPEFTATMRVDPTAMLGTMGLHARLGDTGQDLSIAAEIIELCLQLLEDPAALYQRRDDQQRRQLNQALFEAFVHPPRIRRRHLGQPPTQGAIQQLAYDPG
ncbi:hypothetical protein ACEZDB_00790 [Streptacidiphilus sp. N1-3]|uniref:Uncharacterized protein n=1 Tax=Streptacidiphilus alkalitolerans TaxID=3342712 RepID=A0ABV6WTD9_9ACTN